MNMKVEQIEVDSRVFGRNVLAIYDLDAELDFGVFERSYVREYKPVYVYCKIPLERITGVHALERHGFNLIECQIQSSLKLRKLYDVSKFDYEMRRVSCEEELAEVLDIASTTFTHDRFSIDRALDSAYSGMRYREYVRKSFLAPNEAVYRLVNRATGRTVAFKTHRYISDTEVLCLLGGVHPDKLNLGIGVINTYFELNELMNKGIKKIITHISASNYPVFNLEIGNLGFWVETTLAVMRKVYP